MLVRVRHIKGLLDLPICMVEDNVERRFLWSPPSGEDYAGFERPRGSTRYGSNRDKHLPAVGIGMCPNRVQMNMLNKLLCYILYVHKFRRVMYAIISTMKVF